MLVTTDTIVSVISDSCGIVIDIGYLNNHYNLLDCVIINLTIMEVVQVLSGNNT